MVVLQSWMIKTNQVTAVQPFHLVLRKCTTITAIQGLKGGKPLPMNLFPPGKQPESEGKILFLSLIRKTVRGKYMYETINRPPRVILDSKMFHTLHMCQRNRKKKKKC